MCTRLLLSVLAIGVAAITRTRGPFEWAFTRLDYARAEKVEQLRRFCDRIHGLAVQASQDRVVTGTMGSSV